jgi:hypothetical protein
MNMKQEQWSTKVGRTFLDTNSSGLRAVLNISPMVIAEALVSAQKSGLNLREWCAVPW